MVLNKNYNEETDSWEMVAYNIVTSTRDVANGETAEAGAAAVNEEDVNATTTPETKMSDEDTPQTAENKVSETASSDGSSKEEEITTKSEAASSEEEKKEDEDDVSTNQEEKPAAAESPEVNEKGPLLSANENNSSSDTTDANNNKEEESSSTNTRQPPPPRASAADNRDNRIPGWLRDSVQKIGTVLQEADAKHQIHSKVNNGVKVVGDSINKLQDTLHKETREARRVIDRESVRFSKVVQEKAEEVDLHSKTKAVELKARDAAQVMESKARETAQVMEAHAKKAGESIHRASVKTGEHLKTASVKTGTAVKTAATKTGEAVKTANKDGKVTDILAAAAVVGAGLMFARGRPGAGAALFATGGAAYAASEATRTPRRYDDGLNEDLHMD